MSERYHSLILDFLASTGPVSQEALAEQLRIPSGELADFQQALATLADSGRLSELTGGVVALPPLGRTVTGTFRQTSRGFGFVLPTEPNAHGDLFIPAGENLDAVTGDLVVAKVVIRGDKADKKAVSGRITEILKRNVNRCVGTVQKHHQRWIVVPDGNVFRAPIDVPDVTAKNANEGDKVVVELLRFPTAEQSAQGVIVEVLGARGEPEVELQSVIRQFDLPREFPPEVLDHARQAATGYDPANYPEREDLSDEVIVTIDPPDARDFDDAISLKHLPGIVARPAKRSGLLEAGDEESSDDSSHTESPGVAVWELGVHIADVSAFVTAESPLDMEARARGNSIYFPRHVIPMLPEVLSNGVCSLQEDQPRLTKSAFIRYDAKGQVVGARFANTIIRSRKRLTYLQAQAVIDDAKGESKPYSKGLLESPPNPNVPQVDSEVRTLLVHMDRLARTIRQRRLSQGMIVLDLPEVELVMGAEGRVIDARPEDDSFTHKIIEMFMVEANEAVSRFLTSKKLAVLRRIHPDPDIPSGEQMRQFVMFAGKRLPKVLDRAVIQELLDSVRGTPIAYAVHLAVLKTFSTAEYSPMEMGHYALASENYAHFTSPIRRYADLVIHRALDAVLRGRGVATKGPATAKKGKGKKRGAGESARHAMADTPAASPAATAGVPHEKFPLMPTLLGDVPDYGTLLQLGKHLSFTERRAADAEREIRQVKVLTLLSEHVGDVLDGVITGVTGFGVFVQSTKFLTEGMIRVADLPEDYWIFDDRTGSLRGQRSGRRIALGDRAKVQIVAVNIPGRQLDLRLLEHGSGIGGETGLRNVEPKKRPKPIQLREGREYEQLERPRRSRRQERLQQQSGTPGHPLTGPAPHGGKKGKRGKWRDRGKRKRR